MRYFPLLAALFLMLGAGTATAQISISEARTKAEGTTVTVKGIALNGDELGIIRYITDGTGYIPVYGTNVNTIARGDSLTATGKIFDFYGLLEISPASAVNKLNSGNTLPDSDTITIDQIVENKEAHLVKLQGVYFREAGDVFVAESEYALYDSQNRVTQIFTREGHPLVGQAIPIGKVDVTGLVSEHLGVYQVLPRDINDITRAGSIRFASLPAQSNQTQTGFDLAWTTNVQADTSWIVYGTSAATMTNGLEATISGTGSSVSISGLTAGNIYFAEAYAAKGTDTTSSSPVAFATVSTSSGAIQVYFNQSVDHTVSSGTDAIQLENAIDDTLIAYINRAQESIDFACYNLNNEGISNISAALNAAHTRGVRVRVVYDGSTANLGIDFLNSAIGKIISPLDDLFPAYGIMHNKFIVFDANHASPNVPLVWTGSTNLTEAQIETDDNNVIIVQDQALARAYTIEFEEMFGSTGAQPSQSASRFGRFKLRNTPTRYKVGGKEVELYFSPTDGVNAQIKRIIGTANTNLYAAVMTITRAELGDAIKARKQAGADCWVIENDTASTAKDVWNTLAPLLGDQLRYDEPSTTLHHKYMIIDEGTASDPLVLTGSHNWSASADEKNDENTLVVHDATIANIYYQEFVERYRTAKITAVDAARLNQQGLALFPNPASTTATLARTAAGTLAVEWQLYSPAGTLVQQGALAADATSTQLNLNGLSAGLYLLRTQSATGATAVRLMVR